MAQLFIGPSQATFQDEPLIHPNALEIVGTHRALASVDVLNRWIEETPEGFKFVLKMPQMVSHFRRLGLGASEEANRFVDAASPIEKAGKLGPFLIQLPHSLMMNLDLLDSFLKAMRQRPGLRLALEFRSVSWHTPEVEKLLRKYGVAWVASDRLRGKPEFRSTAPFSYLRLRKNDYREEELAWAVKWSREQVVGGADCFVFLNHRNPRIFDLIQLWRADLGG